MKSVHVASQSVLVLSLLPGFLFAATATSHFGPSAVTAGVVCSTSPNSQTAFGSPAVAFAGCPMPSGTSSRAWAEMQSIAISGWSDGGNISGAPEAVTDLLPLVTPTRTYSHVELAVATSHVDDFSIPWVKLTFDVAWYGSDPGTALQLRIWEQRFGSQLLRYDVTHVGPISLQETFSLEGTDVLDFTVEGRVIATSTPEPAVALSVGSVLIVLGCLRWSGRKAVKP